MFAKGGFCVICLFVLLFESLTGCTGSLFGSVIIGGNLERDGKVFRCGCARRYLACLVALVLVLVLRLAPRKRYLVMILKLVGSVHKR